MELHCPFCGWNRIRDTSKQANVSWNILDAANQLCEHLDTDHPFAWHALLDLWSDHVAKSDHLSTLPDA
jgi:hypothetical protein